MSALRFGGYSIKWQRGLRQVHDMKWMEPVWATHYRRTSAAVQPRDSTPSFILMLWCPVSVCVCVHLCERERPAAEQNNKRRHAPMVTPATYSRQQKNKIRKNSSRIRICNKYKTDRSVHCAPVHCVRYTHPTVQKHSFRHTTATLICQRHHRVFVNHIFLFLMSKPASWWMH